MIPFVNKTDNFEHVRDAVAQILASETVSQQSLAEAAGEDSDDWAFDVYIERINPWDSMTSTPIVNVWFDSENPSDSGSNSSSRQRVISRINCDVYVMSESLDTETGHTSGDEQSSKDAQRIARLVRNILMHEDYDKLGLDEVWKRKAPSITMFQPTSGNQAISHVVGCRLAFDIEHNEEMVFSEDILLDGINVRFYHEPDGLLRAELNYGTVTDPEE